MPTSPTMPDPFAPPAKPDADVSEVPIREVISRSASALSQVIEYAATHATTLSATKRHLLSQKVFPAHAALVDLLNVWDAVAEPE